ncbi:MAG TPA: penicillin acylase family protein, partial [Actinomycetota bacterium]|nr:penicillin acylase family protein [Actinomycetota bacterium]
RWVGADASVEPSTLLAVDSARDWEEFRAAFEGWRCPGQNAVYADTHGNIGYQLGGLYPVRRTGDGTVPVPGWTEDYEWDGWVPYDELPRAYNPEEGFLVTANNKIHGDDYPHVISRDFLPPFRARRIAQLVTEEPHHTADTFRRIQLDTVSLPAREMLPFLVALEPRDDRQKHALAVLAEWDGDVAAGSSAAAIYEVWCERVARAVLRPMMDADLFTHFHGRREWTNAFQYQVLPTLLRYPTARWFGRDGAEGRDGALRDALDAALDELTQRFGDDIAAWRWGALHRVTFAGRLAMIPDLAEMCTAGVAEVGGDEQTVMQGMYEPEVGYDVVVAPSWRQVIDLGDLDASMGTNTTGQSGNPASPHFNDLFDLWSTGGLHPMPFSRPSVEAAARGTLRLLPPG